MFYLLIYLFKTELITRENLHSVARLTSLWDRQISLCVVTWKTCVRCRLHIIMWRKKIIEI